MQRLSRGFRWLLLASGGLLVALALALVVIPGLYLQLRLHTFAAGLFAYPLPPDTVELGRVTEAGLLDGSGDHCDFRAVRLLATRLDQAAISAYYQDAAVPPVTSESKDATIWRDDGLIPVRVRFLDQPAPDGRLRFQISIYDYGYPSIGFRCS